MISGSSRGATKRASETLVSALSTRSTVVFQTGPQIGAKHAVALPRCRGW